MNILKYGNWYTILIEIHYKVWFNETQRALCFCAVQNTLTNKRFQVVIRNSEQKSGNVIFDDSKRNSLHYLVIGLTISLLSISFKTFDGFLCSNMVLVLVACSFTFLSVFVNFIVYAKFWSNFMFLFHFWYHINNLGKNKIVLKSRSLIWIFLEMDVSL